MAIANVTWIPAHPSYGSMSMNRYAALLENAREENDVFNCQLLVSPKTGRKSSAIRQLNRRLLYPLKVKSIRNSRIAHILDHSWSDLLPRVPKGMKTVVTVHDLIPLRFPGELKLAQQLRFKKWVSYIEQADAIVSVSEYTKGEITDLLKIPSSKITIVPNGVEMPEPRPTRTPSDRGEFVIGSIGSILQRKNLGILPEAFEALISKTGKCVKLVRVGVTLPESLSESISAVIGAENLRQLGKIPDNELANFYNSVDCIVLPSLYEGFGLPVLEAMASKVPVVCSNSSSLPEVGVDIPLYIDPTSPMQLADQLETLATKGMQPERLEQGFQKAESMSWRRTLEQFHEIYRSLLK